MSTKTTQHLSREHKEAMHLLAAFRRYLEHLERSEISDPREPAGMIDFLGESFFQKHEEKEEGVLLPELSRMGMSWSDGALSKVRKEHRHGRYFMRSLRHAMLQGQEWSDYDRRHFISVASDWVNFLRDHMLHEEQVLFPFIDSKVSPELDDMMVRQFEAIDKDYAEMPDTERLRRAGQDFLERFGGPEKTK